MAGSPEISWCSDESRVQELADFFASNVDSSYISHSELQGLRALSPERWRDDLPAILADEIRQRVAAIGTATPGPSSKPILVAQNNDGLVGLAFVTFCAEAPVPFSILEDLIVKPTQRGAGIGTTIVEWVAHEARARRIERIYLESGATNHRAHKLFHRVGFEICSHVMMKSL